MGLYWDVALLGAGKRLVERTGPCRRVRPDLPSTMRTLLTRPGSVNIAGAAPLSTLKIELNKAV